MFFLTLSVAAQKVDSIVSHKFLPQNVVEKNQLKTDSLLQKGYTTANEVYPGRFDTAFQDKYQGSDFDYTVNKPKESVWNQFKNWLNELLDKLFYNKNVRSVDSLFYTLLRIVAIAVIGVVLYFLIRLIISRNGNWIFSKKNKQLNPKKRGITENIHELDIPYLIRNYEAKKDYRSAIRYQFLYLLKLMTDKKLLEWDPEKTNRDYIRMLNGHVLQADFQKLSFVFENIWYGERSIAEGAYALFRIQYQQAQQKI